MDDRIVQEFWDDVKRNAELHAREELVSLALVDEQGRGKGECLDRTKQPLDDWKQCLINPFHQQLFQKQFTYLCEIIFPSELYRATRTYHELKVSFRSNPKLTEQLFQQLLQATTNKTVRKRLLQYDVEFVLEHFKSMLRPNVPLLEDWNSDTYKKMLPQIIADTSIPYSEKRKLTSLFRGTEVTVEVLKEWDVEPPNPQIVLPDEMYQKRFMGDWIFPSKIGTNALGLYGGFVRIRDNTGRILDVNLLRDKKLTVLYVAEDTTKGEKEWKLIDQIEYRGLSVLQLEKQTDKTKPVHPSDFLEFAEFQRRRQLEKISLYELVQKLILIQFDKCVKASDALKDARDAFNRVDQSDVHNRAERRKRYRTLREAASRFTLQEWKSIKNQFDLQDVRTYAQWCKYFGVPISDVETWKAAHDNERDANEPVIRNNADFINREPLPRIDEGSEGARRFTTAIRTAELERREDAMNAAGMAREVPDDQRKELLQTLETMWRVQVEQWDAQFKKKTRSDYLTFTEKKKKKSSVDSGVNVAFPNDTALQNIVNRRNDAAARLALVQDRLAEINQGPIRGSIAQKRVSGLMFVNVMLRSVIPYAYARLTKYWQVDRDLNLLENDIRTASARLHERTVTLDKVQNALQDFIHSYYVGAGQDDNKAYRAAVQDRNTEFRKKFFSGKTRRRRGSVGSENDSSDEENDGAPTSGRSRASTVSAAHLATILAPMGPLHRAASVLERVAVEGGLVEDHPSYQKAIDDLEAVKIDESNEPLLVEHLRTLIGQHSTDHTIAQTRFKNGYLEVFKRFFNEGTVQEHCVEYQSMVDTATQQQQTAAIVAPHLPPALESIEAPSPIAMLDSFEEQFQKAAAMVSASVSRSGDVDALEAEWEKERAQLQRINEERELREKELGEKVQKAEFLQIEQQRIAEELLQKAEIDIQNAEEMRISSERKAREAAVELQTQQIEFNKEKVQLQQRAQEGNLSDSVSEASDIDVMEIAWMGSNEHHSDSDASSYEVVEKEIAEVEALENEAAELHNREWKENDAVLYTRSDGQSLEGSILKVHTDDKHPFYTISVDDTEIQTTAERLGALSDQEDNLSEISEIDFDF